MNKQVCHISICCAKLTTVLLSSLAHYITSSSSAVFSHMIQLIEKENKSFNRAHVSVYHMLT